MYKDTVCVTAAARRSALGMELYNSKTKLLVTIEKWLMFDLEC